MNLAALANSANRPMGEAQVRRAGWIMVVFGIILTLMMGALTAGFAYILLVPQGPHGTTFTGDATMAAGIMALFVFLLAFGIAGVFTGISQIRTGRRNLRFVKFALAVVAVIMVLGTIARALD